MVGSSKQGLPSWMEAVNSTRKLELDKNMIKEKNLNKESSTSEVNLSFRERAFSAGGAAFISAAVVNPLDVAKVLFLKADCKLRLLESLMMAFVNWDASVGIYIYLDLTLNNAPNVTPYVPLFAGSLARSIACITRYPMELARTRMQAFKHSKGEPPGVWKTMADAVSPIKTANRRALTTVSPVQSYRFLWTGLGAQLARDVPFSAVCWSSLEPLRRRILRRIGNEASVLSVVGANF